MKPISLIVALFGAAALVGCNSPKAAIDPNAAAQTAPNAGSRKIVGYSNDPQAAPSYGDAAGGGGGGGGHHH
ncbi:hypothetical protein [Methylocystis heyeri]|uniref:Lipoprotein n=1 Tax=Methylocystis heyeri TaxID=391905 RepID=A0A6B8KDU2_9HYPH|nr:hypothetical protein [Methylocystis heyeri]QGM46426.1 hypothetical protein H2LOC_012370 [Methylocystis heyeri]